MPIVNTCSLCEWVRLLSGHAPSPPGFSQHAPLLVQPLIASLNKAGQRNLSCASAHPRRRVLLTRVQVPACATAPQPQMSEAREVLLRGIPQPTILFLIKKAEALKPRPSAAEKPPVDTIGPAGSAEQPPPPPTFFFFFTLPHTPNDNGASTTGRRSAGDHTRQHAPRLPSSVLQFHYRPQWQPRIHYEEVLSTAAPVFWQRHPSESACHYGSVAVLLFGNDFLTALKTKWCPTLSQV